MVLDEPYNSWLVKNVGENLDEKTRFITKARAITPTGPAELDVNLDLTWFMLLHTEGEDQMKLDVAQALLKKKGYLDQFKATLTTVEAKRLIAEFLLSKIKILEGLKSYIDFSQLDAPLDFISHALLIKLNKDTLDSAEVTQQRLKIVNMVLDSGFKLPENTPAKSQGVAIHKVLMMDIGAQRFVLAQRLLKAGFQLFGDEKTNNSEIAITLVDNRTDAQALNIIKNQASKLKTVTFPVAGSPGANIADYYYWVKEDMRAVEFLRSTCNIDITP